VISFKDNGPGISSQDQEHLFERFYRVGGDRARETGGTGLGLSIVKNIITAHRGRVSLESSPGAGSTFTVTLPLKYFPD
jgi:signal transduction histidine kinase